MLYNTLYSDPRVVEAVGRMHKISQGPGLAKTELNSYNTTLNALAVGLYEFSTIENSPLSRGIAALRRQSGKRPARCHRAAPTSVGEGAPPDVSRLSPLDTCQSISGCHR